MSNLSLREINKLTFNEYFVPNKKYIRKREKELINYNNLWEKIHRGQFPELTSDKKRNWEWFYRDYVNTYLEKDIKKVINIRDEVSFKKFLVCIAARIGRGLISEVFNSNKSAKLRRQDTLILFAVMV